MTAGRSGEVSPIMSTTSQASINAVLETAVPVAAAEEVKAIALQIRHSRRADPAAWRAG